ncbi:MAG: ABC transporter permease, partial [Chloroflexi bacterium]|nr:ABC transporter permease [Chloroflexota bacterium]
MSIADAAPAPIEAETQHSPSFRALRRLMRRPVAVVAIIIIVVIYGAGILAPWVAPYGFNEADFQDRFAAPSLEHPLGTDNLGRDLLSRSIWSAQTTVIVSLAA